MTVSTLSSGSSGGGAPSGPAGGDLSGTYPNPAVAAAHFGGADGQYMLRRSGIWAPGVPSYADLSNIPASFTPSAHEATHIAGGADALPYTTIHGAGTHAARPAAGAANAGYLYFETDTGNLFRSDGAAWTQVAVSAGGGSALTNGSATLALNADGTLAQTGAGSQTITATSVNANLTGVTFGAKSPLRMTIYIAVSGVSAAANTLLFNIHFSAALASVPAFIDIQPFVDATGTHAVVSGVYYVNTPTTTDIPVFCTAVQALNSTYGIQVQVIL